MLADFWADMSKWFHDNQALVNLVGFVAAILGIAQFVGRIFFHVSLWALALSGLGIRRDQPRTAKNRVHESGFPQRVDRCRFCEGTGRQPGSGLAPTPCQLCLGSGEIKTDRIWTARCVFCGGSGRQPGADPVKPCEVCDGVGLKRWD